MQISRNHVKSSGVLRKWIVTLAAMLFSFCCPLMTILCLYLPDRSTRPVLGSFFYLFGAFMLTAYFLLEWRNVKHAQIKPMDPSDHGNARMVITSRPAIIILKWMVSGYSVMFSFLSTAMASLCLFGLPDGSAQPHAAIIFLFCGLLVMGTLLTVAWRNWATV
jgi:hypothetical protein